MIFTSGCLNLNQQHVPRPTVSLDEASVSDLSTSAASVQTNVEQCNTSNSFVIIPGLDEIYIDDIVGEHIHRQRKSDDQVIKMRMERIY